MSGVDGAHDLRQRGPFVVDLQAPARMGDRRRFMPDGLQEPRDAVAAGRRTHQHRRHVPLSQLAREVVENTVLGGVDVADELLHQCVVIVGEFFEHRISRLLFLGNGAGRHFDDAGRRRLAVDEGALEREIDESGGDAVLPHGNLTQQQRRSRRWLEHLQRLAQTSARLVDLVQKEDPRQAELLQFAQNHLQCGHLSRIGLAHHHGGVADRQREAHVMDEFDRTGAVEKSQAVAHVVDAGDVGLDAHCMAARFWTRIADARPFSD